MKKNEIYSIARAVEDKHRKELEELAKKMIQEAAEKFSKKFGAKALIEKSGNGFTSSQDWVTCGIVLESFVKSWIGLQMAFARMYAMSPVMDKEFKKMEKGKLKKD
jgi:hypothetical protein